MHITQILPENLEKGEYSRFFTMNTENFKILTVFLHKRELKVRLLGLHFEVTCGFLLPKVRLLLMKDNVQRVVAQHFLKSGCFNMLGTQNNSLLLKILVLNSDLGYLTKDLSRGPHSSDYGGLLPHA